MKTCEQPTLFDQPKDHPSTREQIRARTEALKAQHHIFTQGCIYEGTRRDWMAFPFELCKEVLAGYNLTKDEQTNPMDLFAGYCRLMEESGLCVSGHPTEREAVEACVEAMRKFNS